jgi:hypothetical protein
MKKYLLIPLIVLMSFQANAQDTCSCRKNHELAEIGLITTSVITGALGDGLNSRAKYSSGHFLASVSIVSILAVPFVIKPNWKFPVTYILLRYALFDGFYNVGANRNLNYIGGKNYYDETAGRVPLGVFDASKFLSIGAVIYINRPKRHLTRKN